MLYRSQPLPGYSTHAMVKRAASRVHRGFQDRSRLLFLYLQGAQQCRTLSPAGGSLGSLIAMTTNKTFS